jgi:hypothetical protein
MQSKDWISTFCLFSCFIQLTLYNWIKHANKCNIFIWIFLKYMSAFFFNSFLLLTENLWTSIIFFQILLVLISDLGKFYQAQTKFFNHLSKFLYQRRKIIRHLKKFFNSSIKTIRIPLIFLCTWKNISNQSMKKSKFSSLSRLIDGER